MFSSIVYTLFFFLYLSLWPNFYSSIWVLLRVVLSLRVYFCSDKWTHRPCWIFDIFIHPNSHVNQIAGEIVIFGGRLLRLPWLRSN